MADQLPSFEHALETDMQRLASEITKSRERPELRGASEQEMALIKEALRVFPASAQSAQQVAPATRASTASPLLPDYAQDASAEVKLEIEYLIDLAFREGIGKAFAEAGKSPYFVEDAFRDVLAGKLYPELKKRGIVE